MTTVQVVIWVLGQLQMIALLAILIVRGHPATAAAPRARRRRAPGFVRYRQ